MSVDSLTFNFASKQKVTWQATFSGMGGQQSTAFPSTPFPTLPRPAR
jgi:hypothetical protein